MKPKRTGHWRRLVVQSSSLGFLAKRSEAVKFLPDRQIPPLASTGALVLSPSTVFLGKCQFWGRSLFPWSDSLERGNERLFRLSALLTKKLPHQHPQCQCGFSPEACCSSVCSLFLTFLFSLTFILQFFSGRGGTTFSSYYLCDNPLSFHYISALPIPQGKFSLLK